MTTIYEIRDLVKIYPNQVVPANDSINLDIQEGEIFGLLGDNGAGKTTLVRQMANLITPTSGSLKLYGSPVGLNPLQVARHVGYMPQGGLTLNNLTISEALYFTAHLRGLDHQAARVESQYLMELWELGEMASRPNTRLSGGQKRLLQIAVAMAASPPILILDEPTNDLDPVRRNKVWEVLRQLNRESGVTVIFITHDSIEAEKIIQRVGILRQGKLVALGRPSDLKAQVDRKLRLELFFTPDRRPALPAGLQPREVDPGRWLVYIDRSETGPILNALDLSQFDDFRLYSATLEDLYLYYARQNQ